MRTIFWAATAAFACTLTIAEAGTLTTLATLPASDDGAAPYAPLTSTAGGLYGTTLHGGHVGNGSVFRIDPATNAQTTVYSFTGGLDGASPVGAVVEAGGYLYGTTTLGGAGANGTIYRLDPATGALTTLYAFPSGIGQGQASSGLVQVGGFLFGTTAAGGIDGAGTIFRVAMATGKVRTVYQFTGGADGGLPIAGMIPLGGALYGTTNVGGATDAGAVFRFDPSTFSEAVIYDLPGGIGAGNPYAPLVAIGTTLYGTSLNGGTGWGSVFKVDTVSGVGSTLYAFNGPNVNDGAYPYGGLAVFGGQLYGTADYGGTGGPISKGTVFKLDPSTGAETILHSFTGQPADGESPIAGLTVQGAYLYGATSYGGRGGVGVLFRLDPVSASITQMHQFTGYGTLTPGLTVQAGHLYGVTQNGGDNHLGSIFSVDPTSGALTTLYSFTGATDGYAPQAALATDGGSLFGPALGGDATPVSGTVFHFNPAKPAPAVLHTIANAYGVAFPSSPLTKIGSVLYGTAAGNIGSPFWESIFSVQGLSGKETAIASFGFSGNGPLPRLTAVGSVLYGTISSGGAAGSGEIFTVDPATHSITPVYSFANGLDGASPDSAIVADGTVLYGVTLNGGASNAGTVYKYDPLSKTETVIHTFSGGMDGANPRGGLLKFGGNFFGTTFGGGANGGGTLFFINAADGKFATAYSFTGGADGAQPRADLVTVNRAIYGTTSSGTANAHGTVFRFTP